MPIKMVLVGGEGGRGIKVGRKKLDSVSGIWSSKQNKTNKQTKNLRLKYCQSSVAKRFEYTLERAGRILWLNFDVVVWYKITCDIKNFVIEKFNLLRRIEIYKVVYPWKISYISGDHGWHDYNAKFSLNIIGGGIWRFRLQNVI